MLLEQLAYWFQCASAIGTPRDRLAAPANFGTIQRVADWLLGFRVYCGRKDFPVTQVYLSLVDKAYKLTVDV
jgi:hypothetical protein